MAIVLGTNAGFVTTAPTADPSDSNVTVNGASQGVKDTTPASIDTVTEIGWWADNDTSTMDFDVGIYEHESGGDNPGDAVGINANNTKSTGTGWKVVTGLNFSVSASTIYWVAFQLDGSTASNFGNGGRRAIKFPTTALLDPWGSTSVFTGNSIAVYGLVESSATGTNMQINIGDTFKEITAAQINIGDVWKTVNSMQINIGDVWKTIF